MKSIGTSGTFYATALKTLKRDFGDKFLISHLKLKNLLDQFQIKGSDRITLRQYHHQLKTFNAWLISIRYETPILSNKNLTKAVTCLLQFLRQDFFKDTRDFDLTGGTLNLIGFKKWLEKKTKILFNPLSEIITNQDSKFFRKDITENEYKDMKGCSINVLHKNGFSTTNHQLPTNKSSANESQRENEPKIKCWLCSDEHRVMDCDEFRSKSVDERKEFVKKKVCVGTVCQSQK